MSYSYKVVHHEVSLLKRKGVGGGHTILGRFAPGDKGDTHSSSPYSALLRTQPPALPIGVQESAGLVRIRGCQGSQRAGSSAAETIFAFTHPQTLQKEGQKDLDRSPLPLVSEKGEELR